MRKEDIAKLSSRKRSNLWLKIKLAVLLMAFLSGGIYLVFYSPVFKIKTVNVAIADFDTSKLSGLIGPEPQGRNLIFWSPTLNTPQYPELKDLEIHKDYLHRSIEITGSIRNKKIVWCFKSTDNKCFWVDETGYIFIEAPSIEGAALTVVNDYRPSPLSFGDNVLPSEMFDNLSSILVTLADLNLPISRINIENLKLREFVAYVDSGPKMTFSLEANPSFVKPALSSLIKSSTWAKTKTVNLTVEGRVYQGF